MSRETEERRVEKPNEFQLNFNSSNKNGESITPINDNNNENENDTGRLINEKQEHISLENNLMRVPIKIGNINTLGLLDSGSQASILSLAVFNSLPNSYKKSPVNREDLSKTDRLVFKTISGELMSSLGHYNIKFKTQTNPTHTFTHQFFIIKNLSEGCILGADFMVKNQLALFTKNKVLGLMSQGIVNILKINAIKVNSILTIDNNPITLNVPEKYKPFMLNLLKQHPNIYATKLADIGTGKYFELKIALENERPIFLKPRKIPYAYLPQVNAQIQEMLDCGIIRESKSPFCSPIVCVKKRNSTNGNTPEIRICIDYRLINKQILPLNYPLPLINTVIDSLSGRKVYSCLDLYSGYTQYPVAEESKKYTSFATPSGQYEYNYVPMGLKTCPSFFSHAIQKVLKPILHQFVESYLDDICVMSNSIEEHKHHLEILFKILEDGGLKLKLNKCSWFQEEITFLGFNISARGIQPSEKNIEPYKTMRTPSSLRELKTIMGNFNYFRKFVANFSSIAEPLYELHKKNTPWKWELKHQRAFETLRDSLISRPCMRLPILSREFHLYVDSSGFRCGAILCQFQPPLIKNDKRDLENLLPSEKDEEVVISYASKILNEAQKRYSTTEREFFAVLAGIKAFRMYLAGRLFYVLSDHAGLQYVMEKKELGTTKMQKWALQLAEYDFKIIYVPGKQIPHVDALSRLPVEEEIKENKNKKPTEDDIKRNYDTEQLNVKEKAENFINKLYKTKEINEKLLKLETEKNFNESKLNKPTKSGKKREINNEKAKVIAFIEKEFQNSKDIRKELNNNNINARKIENIELRKRMIENYKIYELPVKSVTVNLGVQDWIDEQHKDDYCREILDKMASNVTKKNKLSKEKFKLLDYGLLTTKDGRAVVPQSKREEVLFLNHSHKLSSHLGHFKCLGRIQKKYFWKYMAIDVIKYINNCKICNMRKSLINPKAPLQPVETTTEVMRLVSSDLIGPLPETTSQNKYICNVTDYATRYVISFPIPDKSAKTLAEHLVPKVFTIFGGCSHFLTDQDSAYNSDLIKQICALFGIDKIRSSAYHSRGDALIESYNRVCGDMVASYCHSNPDRWDQYLHFCTLAYNSSKQNTTKFTPFELMFGREPILPTDLGPLIRYRSIENHAEVVAQEWSVALELARQNITNAQQVQKQYYDRGAKLSKYKINEKVFLKVPRVPGDKFNLRVDGPYTILRQTGESNYQIQKDDNKKIFIVHSDRMAKFRGDQKTLTQPQIEFATTEAERNKDKRTEATSDAINNISHQLEKKKGRPKENTVKSFVKNKTITNRNNSKTKKRPGRPRKVRIEIKNAVNNSNSSLYETNNSIKQNNNKDEMKRKRGRPKRIQNNIENEIAEVINIEEADETKVDRDLNNSANSFHTARRYNLRKNPTQFRRHFR